MQTKSNAFVVGKHGTFGKIVKSFSFFKNHSLTKVLILKNRTSNNVFGNILTRKINKTVFYKTIKKYEKY